MVFLNILIIAGITLIPTRRLIRYLRSGEPPRASARAGIILCALLAGACAAALMLTDMFY